MGLIIMLNQEGWGSNLLDLIALAISSLTALGALYVWWASRKARLVIEKLGTSGRPYRQNTPDQATHVFIIRNLSGRPTAILTVFLRDKDKNPLPPGSCKFDPSPPIEIGPWTGTILQMTLGKESDDQLSIIDILDVDKKRIWFVKTASGNWEKRKYIPLKKKA